MDEAQLSQAPSWLTFLFAGVFLMTGLFGIWVIKYGSKKRFGPRFAVLDKTEGTLKLVALGDKNWGLEIKLHSKFLRWNIHYGEVFKYLSDNNNEGEQIFDEKEAGISKTVLLDFPETNIITHPLYKFIDQNTIRLNDFPEIQGPADRVYAMSVSFSVADSTTPTKRTVVHRLGPNFLSHKIYYLFFCPARQWAVLRVADKSLHDSLPLPPKQISSSTYASTIKQYPSYQLVLKYVLYFLACYLFTISIFGDTISNSYYFLIGVPIFLARWETRDNFITLATIITSLAAAQLMGIVFDYFFIGGEYDIINTITIAGFLLLVVVLGAGNRLTQRITLHSPIPRYWNFIFLGLLAVSLWLLK